MITLLFIALSAILDSQRDKIQFDPKRSFFPNWDWWTTRNYMEKTRGRSWVFDTVLSFANDGWHFCKAVSLLFLFTAVITYSPIIGTADILLFYVVYGGVFTLFYDVFHS